MNDIDTIITIIVGCFSIIGGIYGFIKWLGRSSPPSSNPPSSNEVGVYPHNSGSGAGITILLTFLLVIGLIGSSILIVSNWHPNTSSSVSNTPTPTPTLSPDQILYGTPSNALKEFCHAMVMQQLDSAYKVYSSHLQSQITLDQFTKTWSTDVTNKCTSNITTINGNSASGEVHIIYATFDPPNASPHNNANYNVKLVTNNGIWQIDEWQPI